MNKRIRETGITALAIIGFVAPTVAQPINLVPYDSIGPNRVDFEDVPALPFPGFIIDGILVSGNASFAERFVGQTLTIEPPISLGGPFDVLSGAPTDPLTLQPGDPGRNLSVAIRFPDNELVGCGDLGCSNGDGFGEGAVAVRFPAPVSEVGFIISSGNSGGEAVVQFFRTDGTGIDTITVTTVPFPLSSRHGFMREGGVRDIAGVSVHNSDPAGVTYDDFVFGEFSEKGIEILLDPAPANDRYVIDATPTMPSISARAQVVNVTPDPTPMTTFTWTVNLTIDKGTGEEVSFDEEIEQGVVTVGEELFTLEFTTRRPFRGGKLKLTVEAEVDGATLATEREGLTIEGTNPDRSEIQNTIDAVATAFQGLAEVDIEDVLKRIGCQESSGQRQFDASANGGIAFPLISRDNGVGIFQITSTRRCPDPFVDCRDALFHWPTNVREGKRAYEEKVAFARSYPVQLLASPDYGAFIRDIINPDREAVRLRPIRTRPAPRFTTIGPIGSAPPNQLLEDAVRGYNGFAGQLTLDGKVIMDARGRPILLHEFIPDEDFLRTVSDRDVPTLQTNPNVWRRVLPAERPALGNPNYVKDVTSQSPQCTP